MVRIKGLADVKKKMQKQVLWVKKGKRQCFLSAGCLWSMDRRESKSIWSPFACVGLIRTWRDGASGPWRERF